MKKKIDILVFSVVLMFSLNCSRNNDGILQNKAQLLRDRIKTAEEQFGKDDLMASGEVKRWLSELKEAERLAMEAQPEQAESKLASILTQVDQVTSNRDGDLEIGNVKGNVTLSGTRIDTGAVISSDSTLRTEKDSFVQLKLFVDSGISLMPESILKIKKVQAWGRGVICELVKGEMVYYQTGTRSQFFLMAGDREFDVNHACEFQVQVSSSLKGYVLPKRGHVNLVYKGERKKVLFGEGLTWDGSDSSTVLPLMAPELIAPSQEQTFLPLKDDTSQSVQFEWAEVPHAAYYLVNLFHDSQRKQPVLTQVSVKNQQWSHTFNQGVYYWQVKAVGADGLPGYESRLNWFSVVGSEQRASNKENPGPRLSGVEIQLMNDMAIVTGKVSDNASVSVNFTKAVRSQDGSFEVVVSLQMGEQWITIVATDPKGGQTVEKHKVNTEF